MYRETLTSQTYLQRHGVCGHHQHQSWKKGSSRVGLCCQHCARLGWELGPRAGSGLAGLVWPQASAGQGRGGAGATTVQAPCRHGVPERGHPAQPQPGFRGPTVSVGRAWEASGCLTCGAPSSSKDHGLLLILLVDFHLLDVVLLINLHVLDVILLIHFHLLGVILLIHFHLFNQVFLVHLHHLFLI